MHNWVFKQLNIDAHYSSKKLDSCDLKSILQNVSIGEIEGLNVTIPFKEEIIPLLQQVNPRAEAMGAVNVIMKKGSDLIGNNTDWYGFSKALLHNAIDLEGSEVIVLGAGGSSNAILYALHQAGISKIFLLNRTVEKAKLKEIGHITALPLSQSEQVIKNNSVIINCTSVGMNSSQVPIDLGLLHHNQIIIDIIYNPLETPLIKFGKKIGAVTMNGLDMLIFQGLASLDLWFGESLSNRVNFKDLKKYLETLIC